MLDQTNVIPGHCLLISLKSLQACETKAFPLIRPRSLPPKWIISTRRAGTEYSQTKSSSPLQSSAPLPLNDCMLVQPRPKPNCCLPGLVSYPEDEAVATDYHSAGLPSCYKQKKQMLTMYNKPSTSSHSLPSKCHWAHITLEC